MYCVYYWNVFWNCFAFEWIHISNYTRDFNNVFGDIYDWNGDIFLVFREMIEVAVLSKGEVCWS